MKNENLPAIDQGQHERLCAYVFGELQGAERASFESELERSPALRRELEQLTATIDLVHSAVPDEGLSEDVRRDLLASARRSRFRVVRGRRLLQLAAACVVILGGTLAWRRFTTVGERRSLEVRDALVARVDAPSTARSAPTERVQVQGQQKELDHQETALGEESGLEKLRGLGYVGQDSPSVADSRVPAAPSYAPLSNETTEALQALGYGGESDGKSNSELSFGVPPSTAPPVHSAPPPSDKDGGVTNVELAAKSREFSTSADDLAALPAGATSGTPMAFASRQAGAGGRASVAETKGSEIRMKKGINAPAQGGVYRGPGDSLRPSEGVPHEESTSTSTAATSVGVGSGKMGRAKGAERVEPGALVALGYSGGDDSEAVGLQDSLESRRVPVQAREQVAAQVEQLLATSRVAPDESPRDMFFRYFGDAPFVPALEEKVSTFAVDVDTASYALTRAYLNRGELPPREAVRTEEFVNYFKADQPAPTDGKPFALGLELAPSLFGGDARAEMLRVTVRGMDVRDFERQPLRLTLVIDNSGSMQDGGRLELVKRALALLLRQLGSADSIAIVKFSNSAAVVTPMVPATRRGELEGLIGALPIEGGTNVEAGLRLGYEQALQNLARNTVNRVVMCTDGVGNIGETTAQGLLALVKDARAKGIYLNTVGVGLGNHDDAFLEQLADQGDGVCNYVDSDAEAKRVFVDRLASAVQPIARDVKVQVEFDPARVESWRLLGYENRALRTQDFRNDAIDAGEVNAGHQVCALYELVRRSSDGGPLATVRLRYKPPFAIDQGKEGARAEAEAEQASELERTLAGSAVLPGFASASNGYQRAVLVAQFAEVLRQSVHARRDSLATLLGEARRLDKTLGDPDFSEFVTLLEKANPLLDARAKVETPKVQGLLDELARLRYEQALRARERALAVEAKEPAPAPETQREIERVEQEAAATIERLEGELRQACGLETLSPEEQTQLDRLGYGGEEEEDKK